MTLMSTICGIALIPFVQLERRDWSNAATILRDPRILWATAAMYTLVVGALALLIFGPQQPSQLLH